MHSDGSPLRSNRRQVTLDITTRLRRGGTRTDNDILLTVRDDGIVAYEFMAHDDAEEIRVSVREIPESPVQGFQIDLLFSGVL